MSKSKGNFYTARDLFADTTLTVDPDVAGRYHANIHDGWRVMYVFGGVSMGNRFYVEGRYYAFSKVRNFDFSGMNLGLGWRL